MKERDISLIKWCSYLFNDIIDNREFLKSPSLSTPALTSALCPPQDCNLNLLPMPYAAIPNSFFSKRMCLPALKRNLISSQMPFYRTINKEAHGFWQGHTAPSWPCAVLAVGCFGSRLCASSLVSSEKPIQGRILCKCEHCLESVCDWTSSAS